MTCHCIGGNPCPCMRGSFGRITFGPEYTGAAAHVPSLELTELLAKAKQHVMTPKEIYEQRVSWIIGMTPYDREITREEVVRHLREMGIVDPDA